jgi:hypothetical protein
VLTRTISHGTFSLRASLSSPFYLGLSLVVIVTLHTGFQFGWNLHTAAYALMLVVIASGAVGAVFYYIMPERLGEVRHGATKKQMLEILRSLNARIRDAAQPLADEQASIVRLSLERTTLEGSLLERLANRYPRCGNAAAFARISRLVQTAPPSDAERLDRIGLLLKSKSDTLAQLRRYVQIRALLEIWLYVHVPATFAMLAAVTAHIVSVFFYW